ncbi:MAG: hypothetical protein RQ745_03000 [Longimicrobiales bacterium]|nr:hypothetical protein [Longimicrobiales bacterium]
MGRTAEVDEPERSTLPDRPGVRDGVVAALLIVGATLAFHLLLHPRIGDADGFYHLGHALHYAGTSLLDTRFPWTAFSAIGEAGADLWWGFHALLVPFTGVGGSGAGGEVAAAIRVAAGAFTIAALGGVAWLAFRHAFLGVVLWPVLFFVAVPNVLFRYLMVRPEVLSIPLALLLLSALVRRQPWLVLALATAITWVHLSMFWLAPGMAVVWAGATWVDRRVLGRGATPSPARDERPGHNDRVEAARAGRTGWLLALVVAGTALGWLLRPNPMGAAHLAWIQIAQLLFEKTGDTPLTFAVELAPLPMASLLSTAWPLLLAWLGGLAWLGFTAEEEPERVKRIPARERIFLWSTTLIGAGFLALTVLVARRSLVQWAAFAVVGVALVVTHLTPREKRHAVSRVLLLTVPLLFTWSLWRNALNAQYVAKAPDYLEEVALWLADHSEPGDLVFNTHWDTFGPLFARNRVNHYLGGMDPIFQFARDPEAYWTYHHLSTDVATAVTCPHADCTPDQVEDTWEAMRERFGARWVLVEPRRNPRLSRFLLEDERFRLALETQREAVFEVLPPGEVAPRPGFLDEEGGGVGAPPDNLPGAGSPGRE